MSRIAKSIFSVILSFVIPLLLIVLICFLVGFSILVFTLLDISELLLYVVVISTAFLVSFAYTKLLRRMRVRLALAWWMPPLIATLLLFGVMLFEE